MLADLKAKMDAMFSSAGFRPPALAQAPAPEADPEMQIEAPSPGPDRMDINSGGDVPDVADTRRAPQFRSQGNVHDAEVAQIQSVIDGLEQAQANDRHANSSARIGELGLRAGQAVSNGIAHLPLTETGPLTPKISQGDQKLQSAKLKESMKQDLFKRENPEQERMNKLQIEQYKEALRQNEDADRAAQHEKDKKQQADQFATSQSGLDRRAGAGNTTKIAVAEIGAGSNAARGVGENAAKNVYEQAKMGSKRTYDGVKYHAREMVDMNQSNKADHVLETYSMLMPALDELQDLVSHDPRGVAKWGSEARSELVASIQQAAEATTKYNGDGVMNGADQVHAMRQLGSPEEFEHMLTANGGAGLAQFKKTIQRQLHSRLQSLGYEPGDGPDNSLGAAHNRAAKAGAGASNKTPRVSAQNALDASQDALHGKKPTLDEIKPQTVPEASDVPERKDPNKGRTITWTPGQKAKVVE